MASCGSIGLLGQYGLSGGTALRYQHGHKSQSRSWTSVWTLMVPWSMDIDKEHGSGRIMDTDMVLSSSPDLDVTMAQGMQHGPLR